MIPALLALLASLALAGDDLVLGEATADQLAELEHVDAQMADAIVKLREQRGRIDNHEALRVIPGMDDLTLGSLREHTAIQYEFPTGERKRYSGPEEVLAEFATEPGIAQTQAWAADYARLNSSMVSRWLTAAQGFAALPQFRVEYRYKGNAGNDWEYYPSDGIIDTPDEDVFDVLDDANRDREDRMLLRATWDLDKLVMSSERIRIINEAQDIVKLRDKVLTEVTRLYFERRRVQVDMLLSPKRDVAGQVKDQLHLMELTANIDALTGGAFSASLPR